MDFGVSKVVQRLRNHTPSPPPGLEGCSRCSREERCSAQSQRPRGPRAVYGRELAIWCEHGGPVECFQSELRTEKCTG